MKVYSILMTQDKSLGSLQLTVSLNIHRNMTILHRAQSGKMHIAIQLSDYYATEE
jgi:hypothetical protein